MLKQEKITLKRGEEDRLNHRLEGDIGSRAGADLLETKKTKVFYREIGVSKSGPTLPNYFSVGREKEQKAEIGRE